VRLRRWERLCHRNAVVDCRAPKSRVTLGQDRKRQEYSRGNAYRKRERPNALAEGLCRAYEHRRRQFGLRLFVAFSRRLPAPRAFREGRTKRCRARGLVSPVLSALRAVVEMRAAAGSRRRLRILLRKTPGTVGGETVHAQSFMVPVAVAQVAVVRMKPPDEQVLSATAHGTFRRSDERQIARNRVIFRDFACDRRRSRVLPAMTGGASVRVLGARLRDHDQMPARRRPSRTDSSFGPNFIAR